MLRSLLDRKAGGEQVSIMVPSIQEIVTRMGTQYVLGERQPMPAEHAAVLLSNDQPWKRAQFEKFFAPLLVQVGCCCLVQLMLFPFDTHQCFCAFRKMCVCRCMCVTTETRHSSQQIELGHSTLSRETVATFSTVCAGEKQASPTQVPPDCL